ncbi:hypothetical protein [Fulvivirga lutimaris]|uniref:hypothetical protein n=1 Tax=Fulvivirga lutimaris TaxID=1819566 RepID=UPI0012BD1AD1|nr:hypothetical protein [Fulvivirga lutimaris]MTI40871.1 hypothetical protein [Fulvivirga lutimaris]
MKNVFKILCLIIGALFTSCDQNKANATLDYSTKSDSALYSYNLGWKQIMDEGYYSKAEKSYRRALEYDPNFLVGQSVLARLTRDLDERLALYENLEANKSNITGDERLILDVYLALTHFTNVREQNPDKAKKVIADVLQLAYDNFKIIVHKYPDQTYLKAEYIEILHSLYGPQASLDSLNALTSNQQKDNPFLLGYSATINAELENFDVALQQAEQLESLMKNQSVPKPSVVYADIYFRMDSLMLAKKHIDFAYALDSLNVDAGRLKVKIDQELADRGM